jgi:hypothetical protein
MNFGYTRFVAGNDPGQTGVILANKRHFAIESYLPVILNQIVALRQGWRQFHRILHVGGNQQVSNPARQADLNGHMGITEWLSCGVLKGQSADARQSGQVLSRADSRHR